MKINYAVAFFLCVLNSTMFAENVYQQNQFYVAPGVAYYHFSEKRDLQNAAMVNLTLGKVLNDRMAVEAFYGQVSTEEQINHQYQSTRFYNYAVNGVYHFQIDKNKTLHPYLLSGLNITNQIDNNISSGNTTLLGMDMGLGIEYFVNPSISLFTDARDIYTFSGGKNDWMLNAGIKFLFGVDLAETETPLIKTDGPNGFYQLQDSTQN